MYSSARLYRLHNRFFRICEGCARCTDEEMVRVRHTVQMDFGNSLDASEMQMIFRQQEDHLHESVMKPLFVPQ